MQSCTATTNLRSFIATICELHQAKMQLLRFIVAVIAGFQYITGALGAWRYVIDKTSCGKCSPWNNDGLPAYQATVDLGEAGTPLHDSIVGYMNTVQQWAHEICDIFAPYINDPNQRPDDRVMRLTSTIFGNNDMATIVDLYSALPLRGS